MLDASCRSKKTLTFRVAPGRPAACRYVGTWTGLTRGWPATSMARLRVADWESALPTGAHSKHPIKRKWNRKMCGFSSVSKIRRFQLHFSLNPNGCEQSNKANVIKSQRQTPTRWTTQKMSAKVLPLGQPVRHLDCTAFQRTASHQRFFSSPVASAKVYSRVKRFGFKIGGNSSRRSWCKAHHQHELGSDQLNRDLTQVQANSRSHWTATRRITLPTSHGYSGIRYAQETAFEHIFAPLGEKFYECKPKPGKGKCLCYNMLAEQYS